MSFYAPEVEASDFHPVEVRPRAAHRLTNFEFLLIAFVVASFAYEMPIYYVTPRYRLNPRLLDVASIALVSYWILVGRGRWKISLRNPVLRPWVSLVAVFALACLASALWVPMTVYQYSLWYLLHYLKGLAVLLIVLSAPFDERRKRQLLWVALMAGVWVASVAILQYVGLVGTERPVGGVLTGEERLNEGINSTLGGMFHVGQFGILSGLIALVLFQGVTGPRRIAAALAMPLVVVPAVVSGSKSGFVGLLISLGVLATRKQYRNRVTTYLMAGVLAVTILGFFAGSRTSERLERIGGSEGFVPRMLEGFQTLRYIFDEHGVRVLAFGGGFYVVPLRGKHRIGYGIHNIFLFPLEQAGVLAFFVSLWLWIQLGLHLSGLADARAGPTTILDDNLRRAMLAYLFALLVVGWAGEIFYMGFATENLTTYQVLLFGLALMPTGSPGASPEPSPKPAPHFGFDPDAPPDVRAGFGSNATTRPA